MGKSIQERLEEFFQDGFIADAHCDTLLDLADEKRSFHERSSAGHLDWPRLVEGRVQLQFFAAFVGSEYKPERSLIRTLQLIDVFYNTVLSGGQDFVLGLNYRQIKHVIEKKQKRVAVLSIEGGEALGGDLRMLNIYYKLGVRALGLTWNQRNKLADGVWERESGGGLTKFGRQVIKEMNGLGMMVDLAHISEAGFWDAMETSDYPLMVSHANCRKICDHPRNLSNDQIRALAEQRGVIGLTFAPEFIGKHCSLDGFLEHVDHVAGLVGTSPIVIGSDFDGINDTPAGLEDVTKMPKLVTALLERGYTIDEVKSIMGLNLLNYIKRTL